MSIALDLVALAAAYLLGSIPFGLVLTRAAGLGDIRAIGSGNIGATNVLRTGNKKLAAATVLLDGLKGVAAVLLARAIADPWAGDAAALVAVVGHMFPVWLGFKGGKGVATGAGVLLALDLHLGLACAVLWIGVVYAVRMSAAGGLAACLAAPLLALVMSLPVTQTTAITVIAGLIWLRHRANITRILMGKEPRIGEGR